MDQNQSEEEMLTQFVEGVVKETGAADIDVAQAVEAISLKIDEGIVEALPEETMDKMIEAQENGEMDDAEMERLLDESGVDPKPIIERVMKAFRLAVMERMEA